MRNDIYARQAGHCSRPHSAHTGTASYGTATFLNIIARAIKLSFFQKLLPQLCQFQNIVALVLPLSARLRFLAFPFSPGPQSLLNKRGLIVHSQCVLPPISLIGIKLKQSKERNEHMGSAGSIGQHLCRLDEWRRWSSCLW
jgi:hypothetical protein